VPIGIKAQTVRFLDIFLLHCLLADSPPDTPQEIAALGRNQHRTAAHGREPGLLLERGGGEVALTEWAAELLQACAPIAAALDAAHQSREHADALRSAQALLADPALLPSARVLAVMEKDYANSFLEFTAAQSQLTRTKLLGLPFGAAQQVRFAALSAQSMQDQKAIEAADTMPFEIYRQQYVSPERLGLGKAAVAPALVAV
ncbi:MAG TPA: glutamate--cysteine ligase, partial [Ramlibacter sp.]|nr:glutamate--cysteine ligase [Ramlibacter sp.]